MIYCKKFERNYEKTGLKIVKLKPIALWASYSIEIYIIRIGVKYRIYNTEDFLISPLNQKLWAITYIPPSLFREFEFFWAAV